MYRKMLVANDGSPGGVKALEGALDLAKRLDIGLTMVCVEDLPRFPAVVDVVAAGAGGTRRARSTGRRVGRRAGAEPRASRSRRRSSPGIRCSGSSRLVERGGYDLLVVGYLGHSALYEQPHRQHRRSSGCAGALHGGWS